MCTGILLLYHCVVKSVGQRPNSLLTVCGEYFFLSMQLGFYSSNAKLAFCVLFMYITCCYLQVQCSHLLVKHAGSRRPSSWREENITRSKEDAIDILNCEQAFPKRMSIFNSRIVITHIRHVNIGFICLFIGSLH